MPIAGIPEVIHDFNMYNSGRRLVGTTGEVKLPDLEAVTENISGAGILGEYATPLTGRFSSIEQEIPFRVIDEDYFKLIDPTKAVELTLRGAIQYTVQSTGAEDHMGMRVIFRGRPKKIAPGTMKYGAMDSSITLELVYLKIEMDGEERIELDKINGRYRVNGVDILAKVSSLT